MNIFYDSVEYQIFDGGSEVLVSMGGMPSVGIVAHQLLLNRFNFPISVGGAFFSYGSEFDYSMSLDFEVDSDYSISGTHTLHLLDDSCGLSFTGENNTEGSFFRVKVGKVNVVASIRATTGSPWAHELSVIFSGEGILEVLVCKEDYGSINRVRDSFGSLNIPVFGDVEDIVLELKAYLPSESNNSIFKID